MYSPANSTYSISPPFRSNEVFIDIAVYFYPEIRYPIHYEEDAFYEGEDEIWADLDDLLCKEVELLVLNRASAAVCASAVRGIPLVIKDWGLYFDFIEVISREVEDFMQMRMNDLLEWIFPG